MLDRVPLRQTFAILVNFSCLNYVHDATVGIVNNKLIFMTIVAVLLPFCGLLAYYTNYYD